MITALIGNFADAKCSSFLGFPVWYEYIRDGSGCSNIKIDNINDVWLIVAAIVEILLRVAALAAIAFVIYGGFQYLTSEAEPEKTSKAKTTIVNALVGLAIAVMASAIINFVAGSIK